MSIFDEVKIEQDPFKKAEIFVNLHKDKDVKIQNIAQELSVSPSYICNYERLLKLPLLIRDGYYSDMISLTHLFVIARLIREEDMISVYEKTLQDALSTKETEELVRKILHSINDEGEHLDADDIEEIVNEIKKVDEACSVKIIQTRIKAKIIIEIKGNLEKTSTILKKFIKRSKTKGYENE